MTRRFFLFSAFFVIIGGITFSGCASYASRSSSSEPLTSVIETTKDSRQVATKKPLTFPTSVALLFVPDKSHTVPVTVLRQAADSLKQQLLANSKYINSVTVVSMDDISAKVSLEKLRAMYDTEIAIVISYQQDQRSQQSGPGGLVDATVVGAFVAPTVATVTTTVIDGKIIHIASDAMIFRASGTDSRTVHSTSYGRDGTLASESINSILAATTDVGNALSKTLTKFDNFDPAKAVAMSELTGGNSTNASSSEFSNDSWRKVDTFKSGGGGGIDVLNLIVLAISFVWLGCKNMRRIS